MAPSGAFFVGAIFWDCRGYDPLLHHDFPVGGKLLPDIAEADTLFGDMIPSYMVCPAPRRFRGYDPLVHLPLTTD